MNEDISNRIKGLIRGKKIFDIVSKTSAIRNEKVYVVGGYVRDIILNRPSKDIDFVIVGDGIGFAEDFSKALGSSAKLTVFKNFGTANIRYRNYEIEFVGARKESYQSDTRKPQVERGSLTDDLRRRDFTINALAVSLNEENFGELTDLFDGYYDIQNKIIRTPLDPDKTFSDDPLRMMRAIRFASQLLFNIDQYTFSGIKKNHSRLNIVSMERISDELNKILTSSKPSTGLNLLYYSGILAMILPEVVELRGTETVENKSHKDNFHHTLQVVDNVAGISDYLWLRWTALLHDIGKPLTKSFDNQIGWTFHAHDAAGARLIPVIFHRLRLPMNEKMRYVKKLVMLHLRPVALTSEEVTDSAVRRLIVDAGEDIDDLLTLCKADITSKNQARAQAFISRFELVRQKIIQVEEKDRLRNWKNPITGEVIMKALKTNPGKHIGILKEAVKEAIMEGYIRNDFDEAYKYMLKIAADQGLIKSF